MGAGIYSFTRESGGSFVSFVCILLAGIPLFCANSFQG